eukprot:1546385-Pyramimonas_sp.AAC.1
MRWCYHTTWGHGNRSQETIGSSLHAYHRTGLHLALLPDALPASLRRRARLVPYPRLELPPSRVAGTALPGRVGGRTSRRKTWKGLGT